MADPITQVPKIIEVDPTPMWYRLVSAMIKALFIGLLITLGFIIRDYMRVDSVAEVFRQCRKPLIQYRLEKNSWPADFDFNNPPADLLTYGFKETVKKLTDNCSIAGKWSFTVNKGPMGPNVPTIIFNPRIIGYLFTPSAFDY
jgi:hypothetical protein